MLLKSPLVPAVFCLLVSAATAQAPSVALDMASMVTRHQLLAARIDAAQPIAFPAGGLCGVRGATTVKLGGKAPVVLQLPMPQQTLAQVPIVYTVEATPAAAVQSLLVQYEPDVGTVLLATLQGKNGCEVTLAWAAVVLLAERPLTDDGKLAAALLTATACAQADDAELVAAAKALAPAGATAVELATAMHRLLPQQPAKQRPQGFDARARWRSGELGICTMNANLAVALLRARAVPARSLAVVPSTGQKLEMHRIVEWFTDGQFQRFDPSLVHAEVPMRMSQSVVMATTSIAAEQRAGKLRMLAPLGCPWGQEVELLRGAAILHGAEFFWTRAVPLVAFAADDAAFAAAAAAWQQFLRDGQPVAGADSAAGAADLAALIAAFAQR